MTATIRACWRCPGKARRPRDRQCRDMKNPVDAEFRSTEMSVSMTLNGAVIPCLAFILCSGRAWGFLRSSPHDPEWTFQEFNGPATPISIRPRPACGSFPIIGTRPNIMPKVNSISISAINARAGGDGGGQELAFTIADGPDMPNKAMATGLDI